MLKASDRWIIRDAAAMLEAEATVLRESHTRPPEHTEWPGDQTVRVEHDKMLRVAKQLRAIADRPADKTMRAMP